MAKKSRKKSREVAAPMAVGSYPSSDSVHMDAREHEEHADKHEAIAQYHLKHNKPGLAAKHRQASEKHLLASALYHKANRSSGLHRDNHVDRADDASDAAFDFVEKHNLDLGDDED